MPRNLPSLDGRQYFHFQCDLTSPSELYRSRRSKTRWTHSVAWISLKLCGALKPVFESRLGPPFSPKCGNFFTKQYFITEKFPRNHMRSLAFAITILLLSWQYCRMCFRHRARDIRRRKFQILKGRCAGRDE